MVHPEPARPLFTPRSQAPVVTGDAVVLCALERRDTGAMLANDRDAETAARFGWDPGEAALWRCEQWVEQVGRLWRSGERAVFAVRADPDGPLLGIVEAQPRVHGLHLAAERPAAELSWTVVPEHRGRGVATAAVRALVAWCGGEGVRTAWAAVEPDNRASLRVASAAGFRPLGVDGRHSVLAAPCTGSM